MSNNILPEETMTDSDFRRKITDYFLGKNYCITISMNQKQANVIIYLNTLQNISTVIKVKQITLH